MERFLIRDGKISSPGAEGPRRCPEGQLSPRVDSMSLSQLAARRLGWGFHTLRGGIYPDLRFRPRVVGVVAIWKVSDPGMGTYPPRVWRNLGVVPRGNSRRALAPGAPANQQSPSGVWVSTPCVAVSTRAICVFVPGLLKLHRYGRISDPGMGNYPPRVRRDLGVGPRSNSRRALAP